MADSNKTIKWDITAENQGFTKAMEQVAAVTAAAAAQIQGQFGKVGEAFSLVTRHLGALAALLGGGAAFAKGIEATKQLTGEAVKLSKSLGISVEDASRLNVALKSIGSSADVYTDANAKLTRQIRTNEAAVQAMGVKTRGANGQLLDGQQIMTNALTALASYKEGTDRNLAGQQLFGKGAAEVTALLKLNAGVMEEAARKAQALGLVVGPEQAARTKAYKEAMEGVQLVLLGVQNAIGQAVMPVLTELAGWFNEAGPTAVSAFRVAIDGAVEVFRMVMDTVSELWDVVKDVFSAIGDLITGVAGQEVPGAMELWKNAMIVVKFAALAFKGGIELVFEAVRGHVLMVVESLKTFAAVAVAAFRLDWGGVQAAWRTGTANVERVINESRQRIMDNAAKNADAMQRVLDGGAYKPMQPGAAVAPAPKIGTRHYVDPSSGGADSDLLKAQFAVLKASLEGQLAIQKEYLTEAQQAYDDAYKHNTISTEQFYASKLAIEQAGLKGSIDIKAEELRQTQALEARAVKPADKLALKAQEIKITAELTVLTAKLAHSEIQNARELNNELLIKRNAMLEIQRISTQQAASSQVDMDRIASDKRRALRQITDAQALQEERVFQTRLYQIDLQALHDKYALIDNDPIKKAQIDAEIEQLHRKHAVEMAKIDKDIVVEAARDTLEAQSTIEGATVNFLSSLGDSRKSIKDKFLDLAKSIEQAFMDLAAKQIGKQIFGSLTGSFGGGDSGGWLGGLAKSIFGGMPSFDVGTPYVPQDMFAKVHKGEAIVPARYNNGAGAGGSMQVTQHFAISGPADTRTQQQIASAAARGLSVAQRRNG